MDLALLLIGLGFWGIFILTAIKGWVGAAFGAAACIVFLHLIPIFCFANMLIVTALQVRKDVLRHESYLEGLVPSATSS